MKVAVMGAGSIGGYFGGMLARGGHDVTLIARGEHLDAIRRNGLIMQTRLGEFTVPCSATDRPTDVGPVDLALLTTKTYHNAVAIPQMAPMVGPETAILCLQNGVDSYLPLVDALPYAVVLPAAAYIEAGRSGPGVVTQAGDIVRIVAGSTRGSKPSHQAKAEAVCAAFRDAAVDAEASNDIAVTLWTKFLFISTMAGVTSLAREYLRELLPRPEWHKIVVGCMSEIERAGRASGVDLAPTIVADTLDYMESAKGAMSASMHADLLAGRPMELEALNGAVVRAGEAAGVPTPINDVIYAALKPYAPGTA
ncbi:MAG: 2-dehydropantoate 2-reductase [Chloroflexota bacterium]|nr:2-dehydropantoate 2-reductase [Chloroflexota bacterium]MDE2958944.1 2-dehydropantoate 2-reductase [Chloroflexota bacterium]